nr:hypothetical protein [Spirochaeta africana]
MVHVEQDWLAAYSAVRLRWGSVGALVAYTLVRAVVVVPVDVLPDHGVQLATVEDQHLVQDFPADRSDKTFGIGVHVR